MVLNNEYNVLEQIHVGNMPMWTVTWYRTLVWMLLKNCKLSFVKIQYDKPRSKRISTHCDPLCFHNRPQIALCNDLLLHNVPFLDTNNARFIRFYIDFLLQISWMLQNSNLWKKNSILGAQLIIVPEIFRVDGWNQ